MSRLRTCSFKSRAAQTVSGTNMEGRTGGATVPVLVSINPNTPDGLAWLFDSGPTNNDTDIFISLKTAEVTVGRRYFARMYVVFNNIPTRAGGSPVLTVDDTASVHMASVRISTAGKFQLWNETGTPAQIGSDSTTSITTGKKYRLEMSCLTGVGAVDTLEGVVTDEEGQVTETFAMGTGLALSDNAVSGFFFGWFLAPGGNVKAYVSDVAINDDQGSSQNSYPGRGRIATLFPVSDSDIGNWVGGAGGVSNLFAAVGNTPPLGAALASETDLTQIKNIVNAQSNYDVNMTDFLSAGIPDGSQITVVQAFVDHGEISATGTKTGTLLIVSNPAQGVADTFTYGDDAGAATAWPTNWKTKWGTAIYNPSVTLGTRPVLRVGKDASAQETNVDWMGIQVEYVPPPFVRLLRALPQGRTGGVLVGDVQRAKLLGVPR